MKSINKEELHEIFEKLKKEKNEYNFENLYEKYEDLVYRIIFSIIKNKENSEDIKQIVFLKIWKMEKEKLPCNNEASWLYSLAKNETLNYIRNQKNIINLEDIYYIGVEDKELDKIISRDSYNRILSKLDKKEQEIMSLKILANLSFKEIAQVLKEPSGTIKWRYYKSIHILKMLLSNLGMFIITFVIGFKTMFSSKKSSNCTKDEQIMEDINNIIEDDELRKEDAISADNKNSTMQDDTLKNEIKEEIIIQETQRPKDNYIGIGILSISGIFLMITIIFSIFFIKHQLKARKKVSK